MAVNVVVIDNVHSAEKLEVILVFKEIVRIHILAATALPIENVN